MKKALRNKNVLFGGLFCVLFFLLFGFYFLGYGEYAWGFLTFGTTFLLLFVLFLLLEKFLKNRPAKAFRWKKLTSFSAYLAKKENRYKFYLASLGVLLFLLFFARFYFWKGSFSYVDTAGRTITLKYYDYL
ncbi:MAG TPA: hypothetical protein DCZ41_05415, partial [Firmicutes bacterium]|nr:hypothetical protein [Bacillota bacterium]